MLRKSSNTNIILIGINVPLNASARLRQHGVYIHFYRIARIREEYTTSNECTLKATNSLWKCDTHSLTGSPADGGRERESMEMSSTKLSKHRRTLANTNAIYDPSRSELELTPATATTAKNCNDKNYYWKRPNWFLLLHLLCGLFRQLPHAINFVALALLRVSFYQRSRYWFQVLWIWTLAHSR